MCSLRAVPPGTEREVSMWERAAAARSTSHFSGIPDGDVRK